MGKTAVFVLSVLHLLETQTEYHGPSVVVVVHTRELAFQINKEFERFSKYFKGVNCLHLVGGLPIANDKSALKEKKPVSRLVHRQA